MESQSPAEAIPPRPPSADAAREALASLDEDASELASRLVTPWWYHPALGLLVALLIGAQPLPTAASIIVAAVVILLIGVLVRTYTSRYGIGTVAPTGPRARLTLLAFVAVLALLMLSNLVRDGLGLSPGWMLLPAALGFAATVLLGRAYDARLREELAAPGAGR